jgi:hypothetical protein
MLGILGSFIATLLLKACTSWRRIYRESLTGVLLLTSLAEQKLTPRRLRLTASAFMVIMTALVFLSHSPKLASDDIVAQKTPLQGTHGLVTPRTKSTMTSRTPSRKPIRADGIMRPCVREDNSPSACAPLTVRPNEIALSPLPSSTAEVQFLLLAGHER